MTLSAITLFCDDIRHESNGQRILVGVYRRAWLAERLPSQVDRLYAITLLRAPEDSWPERTLVTLTWPGAQPDRCTIDKGDIEAPHEVDEDPPVEGGVRLRTIEVNHCVEDREVLEPGFIDVRVDADGVVIPAGQLALDVADPAAKPPNG
jgi:hypothetical protein